MPHIFFEVFDRKPLIGRKQHYFRVKASNGKVIAQSEGYNNRTERDQAIDLIRDHAQHAPVVHR